LLRVAFFIKVELPVEFVWLAFDRVALVLLAVMFLFFERVALPVTLAVMFLARVPFFPPAFIY
jgi:hypothetical protein